jgi:hypothetical protein
MLSSKIQISVFFLFHKTIFSAAKQAKKAKAQQKKATQPAGLKVSY